MMIKIENVKDEATNLFKVGGLVWFETSFTVLVSRFLRGSDVATLATQASQEIQHNYIWRKLGSTSRVPGYVNCMGTSEYLTFYIPYDKECTNTRMYRLSRLGVLELSSDSADLEFWTQFANKLACKFPEGKVSIAGKFDMISTKAFNAIMALAYAQGNTDMGKGILWDMAADNEI